MFRRPLVQVCKCVYSEEFFTLLQSLAASHFTRTMSSHWKTEICRASTEPGTLKVHRAYVDGQQETESWTLDLDRGRCNALYPDNITSPELVSSIVAVWSCEAPGDATLKVVLNAPLSVDVFHLHTVNLKTIEELSLEERDPTRGRKFAQERATKLMPWSTRDWDRVLPRKKLTCTWAKNPDSEDSEHKSTVTGFTSNQRVLVTATRSSGGTPETILAVLPNPPPEQGELGEILLFKPIN